MSKQPTEEAVLSRHLFAETSGGYIGCSCGWPSREQFDSGEHEAVHVIAELCKARLLVRPAPTRKEPS